MTMSSENSGRQSQKKSTTAWSTPEVTVLRNCQLLGPGTSEEIHESMPTTEDGKIPAGRRGAKETNEATKKLLSIQNEKACTFNFSYHTQGLAINSLFMKIQINRKQK